MTFDFTGTMENIGQSLAGIGIVVGSAYAIIRKVNSDKKSDVTDSKEQCLIDNLHTQLKTKQEEIDGLREYNEELSNERNEAIRSVGKMEGHVQGLEKQVNLLTEQVNKLEKENAELKTEVQAMHAQLTKIYTLMRYDFKHTGDLTIPLSDSEG